MPWEPPLRLALPAAEHKDKNPTARNEIRRADGVLNRIDFQEARWFWSLVPSADVLVPAVASPAWVRQPIDAFILHRLEAKGLSPSPPADKRTLIRRASFDLTGLPPTAEEIDAFLRDNSDQAFERVVDRLLASPHYGERWARHWLDNVRYADTNGSDRNFDLAFAWRYRDYVIRAFNDDKPYDQFVTEQLAGDLMEEDGSEDYPGEALTGASFLAFGAKLQSERDVLKRVMDTIDEMIDVTSRTFLGLTVSCARCHDHKYDPIPQRRLLRPGWCLPRIRRIGRPDPRASHRTARRTRCGQRIGLSLLVGPDAAPRPQCCQQRGGHAGAEGTPQTHQDRGAVPSPLPPGPRDVRCAHRRCADHDPRQSPQPGEGESPTRIFEGDRQRGPAAGHWSERVRPPRACPLAHRPGPPADRPCHGQPDWQYHFGRGIVATASDFGFRGERPSHPELLDSLAREFVRQGWSIKQMHRLIMLSSTYQQSSAYRQDGVSADPENVLLCARIARDWKPRPSATACSKPREPWTEPSGGTIFHFPLMERVTTDQSENAALSTYSSHRRAIYLPFLRMAVYTLFADFDINDPTLPMPTREATVVAPQALFMLNDKLVLEVASAFADQILEREDFDTAGRIQAAYIQAFGRPPSPTELELGQQFLVDLDGGRVRRGGTPGPRTVRPCWRPASLSTSTDFHRRT